MRPGSIILTQEGMVFGTPEFMSPEQAQGKTLDGRSDIYSLAVILYETLTGKLPFEAKSPMEYIQHHVATKPIDLDQRVPGMSFPPGLGAVLAKALAKNLDDRFASAADFARALHRFVPNAQGLSEVIPAAASKPSINPQPQQPPTPSLAQSQVPTVIDQPSIATRGPSTGLMLGVAAVALLLGVALAVAVMMLFFHK
jgi:serine/threonine-protein kinase